MSETNFEDFDAAVAALLAEQEKESGEKTAAETGSKIHLGGKDYNFKSQQEMERAIEQHMAQLETKTREAQAAAATATAALQKPVPEEKKTEKGTVDPTVQAFIKALEEGTMKDAARILLKEGVFDGKIDDPAAVLTDSLLRTVQMDRQTSVNAFLQSHPELRDDHASAGVVEQARQFLKLDTTPDGFEAAYAYAAAKGHLKPAAVAAGQTTVSKPGAPPAPPSARSTGNGQPQTAEEWESFYESLPTAKLDELMRKAYSGR